MRVVQFLDELREAALRAQEYDRNPEIVVINKGVTAHVALAQILTISGKIVLVTKDET